MPVGKVCANTGRRGSVFPWSGERFYVISEGRFKVVSTCPNEGRELSLLLLAPGDGFEAIGLLDDAPHDVRAVALDDFELLEVPSATLLAWCVFGGLVTARSLAGWQGKRAAFLTMAGFCIVLVSFLSSYDAGQLGGVR